MTTLIIEIIIVLAFSAFFSGMEIAFVSSNKMRFEMDRPQLGWTSRIVAKFYQHPNNFISSLLVGNNIALVIYGILMARLLEQTLLEPLTRTSAGNDWLILLIETVISTLIVLVTGEFLPKTLFKLNPNRTLTFFAPITFLFYIVLYPLSKFSSGFSKLLLRLLGVKVSPADSDHAFTKVDLDYLIQSSIKNTSKAENITDEVKIFQNALEFSNCKVRDCIVPRTEIQAVDVHESLEHLKNLFIESGCSKIIVYDGDIDNIVGFIHSSEMFRIKSGNEWTSHIKEVPIVPETMIAQKLMRLLMQQKKSLAVVVDEFGGTSGICTLEDLVEEIFGDIEDEHDQNDYVARQLPNGEYEISGRMEVEKANEVLGLDLPESDEYITIGGLILHEFQSFPKLNEVIRIGHFEFKVIKNTSTKIELVRLKNASD